MRFVFSVMRFVPDPARGEFINIGAVVGSDVTGEWDLRTAGNLKRARKLDDDNSLASVFGAIDALGKTIDRSEDDDDPTAASEQWLTRLWQESNNVIQFSEPAPISAPSLAAAMETIFERLVPDTAQLTLPYKRKSTAVSAIGQAYVENGLRKNVNFIKSAIVAGLHHHEPFDFVVANGQALQLAQAWSFQIPNQDELIESIKAWAWTVADVRADGGTVRRGDDVRLTIPRDVDVEAVFIPPLAGGSSIALEEARSAFQKVNVNFIDVRNAAGLGARAAALLGLPAAAQ
jgi:hypothetical protein